jgi:hypothetical protein
MVLRRKEQEGAAAVAEAAGPDGQEEDERVRKQLEDVTALNRELEERIVAEADTDGRREGSVEQLYELLAQARQLEKTLASMRTQRVQLTAQKRDLAGQLALVTGNTPQLDKETKVRMIFRKSAFSLFSSLVSQMLGRHIHLLDATKELATQPHEAALAAPLFVLQQALLVSRQSCAVVDLGDVGTKPLLSLALECSIGSVVFRVAYCPLLELVAVAENHAVLSQLGHEGDSGLQSPSLSTQYRAGLNEEAVLSSLGEYRPYRWSQLVCGIQAVRSIEDYARRYTIEDLIAKIQHFN